MSAGPQTARPPLARLAERVVEGASTDDIFARFMDWATARGLELYPAQEEAILEILAGKHVILATPTGSGKSLVALALLFKAVCEGKRAFYTAPIKALVSEKFFDWAAELGAEHVGMLTGDASVNPKAKVICCTAEILANLALREGRYAPVEYAVLDEFHYYADRDRGAAWQIPLLELRDTSFVLMSATLGDVRRIADDLHHNSEREVALVTSTQRPVPLEFNYRDTPLHQTLKDLGSENKQPVYLVSFSQRDAADEAQNLTSLDLCTREEKRAIQEAIGQFRFDTPYGKDIKRYVTAGIGLHHAGLLPKYRLLVERLAQAGLLKVISGTDTLGVGVNVPIRTVLFTKLYKFDGASTRLLSARELHQIAGRAGRRGFDTRGWVVCQAPEHVIENKKLDAKAAAGKKKHEKKKPPKDFVPYDAAAFRKLIDATPEELRSSFEVTPGMLVNVLVSELTAGMPHGGYQRLIELIGRSHESDRLKSRHRHHAATLFRALRKAAVIEVVKVDWSPRPHVRRRAGLQEEFSLHQALGLFLVEALGLIDPALPTYPLELLTLVESILEDPKVVLMRQEDKLKGDRIAELKAQGMEYEERMAELEKVTHPKPNADFIYDTFDTFREAHPWLRHDNVRPKSVARDMFERYASFNEYDRDYGLQRSEGVLLRYLTEVYKAVVQTVPDERKNEGVLEMVAYLRTMLEQVDASLVREWEAMLHPEEVPEAAPAAPRPRDITVDVPRFYARLRAEMHHLLKALAVGDWEEAVVAVRAPPPDDEAWTADCFAEALRPFVAEHGKVIFDHRARLSEHTRIEKTGRRAWTVVQTLVEESGDNTWAVHAKVDLEDPAAADGPLLEIESIGP